MHQGLAEGYGAPPARAIMEGDTMDGNAFELSDRETGFIRPGASVSGCVPSRVCALLGLGCSGKNPGENIPFPETRQVAQEPQLRSAVSREKVWRHQTEINSSTKLHGLLVIPRAHAVALLPILRIVEYSLCQGKRSGFSGSDFRNPRSFTTPLILLCSALVVLATVRVAASRMMSFSYHTTYASSNLCWPNLLSLFLNAQPKL
jgi:hypothetical protein